MTDFLLPATATASLGRPEGGHRIETVLQAAAENGIKGIEVCHEALEELASRRTGSTEPVNVIYAAQQVYQMCRNFGLKVIVLQPFAYYEGWLDRAKHREAIERMMQWIKLAHALHTDIIQMPSNFATSGTTGDMGVIIADMVALADLTGAASPPIRIAFESVAWGTHLNLWEQSYDVVKRVNRDNFGLCLDTFHIAGRVWGDPSATNGKTTNAESDYTASLNRMRSELDPSKIFYFQLSDAEKLQAPLIPGHPQYIEGDDPRMTWSRGSRLFPFEPERGGFMPVIDAIETIVNDVGYRGWISMETFHLELRIPGMPNIPQQSARRAITSYKKIYDLLHWKSLS